MTTVKHTVKHFAFAALLSATALSFSMNAQAEGNNSSSASGAGISAGSSVGASGGSPGIGGGADNNSVQGASHPTMNTSTVRANGSTSEGTFDEASTPESDAMSTSDSSSTDTIPLNNSRESGTEDVPNANTTGQSIVNNNMNTSGMPASTTTTTTVTSAYELESGQITQIQRSLKTQGYRVGNVDGIWGPRTAGALRQFQAANNLPVTGELDTVTVTRISR